MARSKFHPTARGHAFEGILYFLERGPFLLCVVDVVLAYAVTALIFYLRASAADASSSSASNLSFYLVFGACVLLIPLLAILAFIVYLTTDSHRAQLRAHRPPNWGNERATFVRFEKKSRARLLKKYQNTRMPIETAIELYFDGQIDFVDITKVFELRYELFTFVITFGHIKWFVGQFLGQLFGHTKDRDLDEVGSVYNRGNDFYNWFLGPCMVYTSALFVGRNIGDETLEEAQNRKIDTTLESVHLQRGQELLDIGSGWGTLVIRAAKKYGANATGCTLAKEQIAWAQATAEREGVSANCSWICDDYREIPKRSGHKKYDVITCLEMAEHVGIKNFQTFLIQVHDMLKEGGMFYIQMCGVRRTWCYEDLTWIMFMGKYVFPGADASTPINWVVQQLERSGFELHRMENAGQHYARTIEHWHNTWQTNRTAVVAKYGERWYRLWNVFLCWSFYIARQGTSSVYMMVCHKNMYTDRFSIKDGPVLNRTAKYVGPARIAYQQ